MEVYEQRQQKIVVMVIELKFVCQISPFVYLKVACIFYVHALLLTGVRLWQILAKKLFQSLLRSLLNHIFHLCANDVLVKPLSLICITSVFLNTNSLNVGMLMEYVALINGRSK